jgi:predicted ATPase/DNA-binding winged helix-turn-helix (wHTH) protein
MTTTSAAEVAVSDNIAPARPRSAPGRARVLAHTALSADRQDGTQLCPEIAGQVDRPALRRERSFAFGPFRLLPTQRLLLEDGKVVHIGSRALDILVMLVERAGELVSKRELMARVWSNLTVVEANLTVHVVALRRALCDGRNGNRYLVNIPGRGYRFVAPVAVADAPQPAPAPPAKRPHHVPASLTRLIGRVDVVRKLTEQLSRQRFLTIVGPGGTGKTSVALAVAEGLLERYEHGVHLVDLAPLSDPALLPNAFASVLVPEIGGSDPPADLIEGLRDKRMLVVLDNCEHLIEAAATLVDEIFRQAPGVRILATSREPLRTRSESVHRLASLGTPPPQAELRAAQALSFAAVQLFVERTAASLDAFELRDDDAPLVADICRRLDGNPLAIELAAARVEVLGIRGLAARLDDCLCVLSLGRRAAPARHQTLRATLDWSYGLLSGSEQAALRRLAIFDGPFTLASAAAVAGDAGHTDRDIGELVLQLVEKSLLIADLGGAEPHFRIPATTRAYALEKLADSAEHGAVAGRLVEHGRQCAATCL